MLDYKPRKKITNPLVHFFLGGGNIYTKKAFGTV